MTATDDRQGQAVDVLPTLMDITSLAEHLGVGPRHVRRLVAERRIPFIKWGHLIRFDPDEVRDWIDENRRLPGAPRVQL
ncbi:MAG TPA: helix-turn-helix domain-containing protein [Acidimicrobiales bacterium]